MDDLKSKIFLITLIHSGYNRFQAVDRVLYSAPPCYTLHKCSISLTMLKPFAIHLLSHLARIRFEMTDSCIFCKIVSNEVRAEIVHRDEQVTAFRDIHPVAPTHILIVPNRHIESVGALEAEDEPLMGHLFTV